MGLTPAGSALLDHQIYLPKDWVLDRERRAEVGIPRSATFRAKPELAVDLSDRVRSHGAVQLDWLTFDEGYGRDGTFLTELSRRGQRYVGEVPVNTTVWTTDPATQVPEYSGRGRPPALPERASVRSVVALGASSRRRTGGSSTCVRGVVSR